MKLYAVRIGKVVETGRSGKEAVFLVCFFDEKRSEVSSFDSIIYERVDECKPTG
jgi:hypothetical protein